MIVVKHGRTQKYKRQWQHRRHLINATPTQFTWQLVRYPNNGASQQKNNWQLWRHKTIHARQTPSDSPRNTRVTPRERNRETTFITKMSNVEYVCTDCHENFDTERNYLNHRDQNHLGQQWKCHLCNRYFMRRLERSLHRAEVHPYEPSNTPDITDLVGGLRPPRKPNASTHTVVHKSHRSK